MPTGKPLDPTSATKTCTRCKHDLPLSSFSRRSHKDTRPKPACKECERAYLRERARQRYHEDEAHRNKLNERKKIYMRENRSRYLATQRHANLKKKYGIGAHEYDAMLNEQGGCCAICRGTNSNGMRLAVDHDHSTGKVRGLLCTHCNVLIGHARENSDLLLSAVFYLREHGSCRSKAA